MKLCCGRGQAAQQWTHLFTNTCAVAKRLVLIAGVTEQLAATAKHLGFVSGPAGLQGDAAHDSAQLIIVESGHLRGKRVVRHVQACLLCMQLSRTQRAALKQNLQAVV
jgi:hypothetical protein